jgi:cytochrome c551/c552
MRKEQGFAPQEGDWFWAKYKPDGTVEAAGQPAGCLSCHGAVRSNDYVFTFPVAPIPPQGPPPPVGEMEKEQESKGDSSSSEKSSMGGDAQPPTKPETATIEALVQKGGCSQCHTIQGIEGATGTIGPNFCEPATEFQEGKITLAFLIESILDPNAEVEEGFPSNVMPQNFSEVFTADEVELLASFIATLECNSS